ncbi:rRNA maturation RNase YbeY [Jiella sonneratiae]|uniref:rRNA maturation RNase YbeY n=1 Tax=Jiella sonneratiae TaxID=2816856 RepID=UPI003CCA02BC
MPEAGAETVTTLPLPGFAASSIVVAVDAGGWISSLGRDRLVFLTGRALAAAARHLGLPAALATEISVTYADDATVREANHAWRGKDKPTNILSFPLVQLRPGKLPGPLAGDLVLAFETVAREAASEEKPFADHLSHLIVHGFLHLLGYDHLDDGEAAEMEAAEIAILGSLGIADPYGEPPDRSAAGRADS